MLVVYLAKLHMLVNKMMANPWLMHSGTLKHLWVGLRVGRGGKDAGSGHVGGGETHSVCPVFSQSFVFLSIIHKIIFPCNPGCFSYFALTCKSLVKAWFLLYFKLVKNYGTGRAQTWHLSLPWDFMSSQWILNKPSRQPIKRGSN